MKANEHDNELTDEQEDALLCAFGEMFAWPFHQTSRNGWRKKWNS